MPRTTPATHAPDPRLEVTLQRIFAGWYNDADFYAFLDLLETLAVVGCRSPDRGVPTPEAFFEGKVAYDPSGLLKRVDSPHVQDALCKAAWLVLNNTRTPLYLRTTNPELLGNAFCQLKSKRALGQFFTPWDVSLLMAQTTTFDLRDRILEAINKAADKAKAHPLGGAPTDAEAVAYLRPVFQSLKEHIEPVTMMEPCCGAGSMLLAYASRVPPWALATGIVRLHAIDLDPRAVQMARINTLLYGIPAQIYCGNALTPGDEKAVPGPWGDGYVAVSQALAAGDLAKAQDLAEGLVGYRPDFVPLKASA